jgi:hypothetical protein
MPGSIACETVLDDPFDTMVYAGFYARHACDQPPRLFPGRSLVQEEELLHERILGAFVRIERIQKLV